MSHVIVVGKIIVKSLLVSLSPASSPSGDYIPVDYNGAENLRIETAIARGEISLGGHVWVPIYNSPPEPQKLNLEALKNFSITSDGNARGYQNGKVSEIYITARTATDEKGRNYRYRLIVDQQGRLEGIQSWDPDAPNQGEESPSKWGPMIPVSKLNSETKEALRLGLAGNQNPEGQFPKNNLKEAADEYERIFYNMNVYKKMGMTFYEVLKNRYGVEAADAKNQNEAIQAIAEKLANQQLKRGSFISGLIGSIK